MKHPKFYLNVLILGGIVLLTLAACQSTPGPQWRWKRAEAGLPRRALVTAVAIDPADNDRLWAGYYAAGGLAASSDGGQTWTTGVEGIADNPVFDLLARDGEVWAATRDGLFHSDDAGQSWQLVTAGLPRATVFDLAFDATGRLYAGLDDNGVHAEGLDGGGWESLSSPHSLPMERGERRGETLASAAVLSLAVSSDGHHLYAGTSALGVFASRDGGQTWTESYPDRYAPNIALNPTNPNQAVASLRDQLVRTQDGGQTWHTLPVDWAQDEIVSLLWLVDGMLGAGTGQGRLYRSLDGGDSWLEGGDGLVGNGGVLDLDVNGGQFLAGSWTGIYGSSDSGQTWRELASALGVPNARVLLTRENELLLGTRTGLFRWQADTQTWISIPGEFPPGGLQSLALDPANPQVIYAGTSGDGLYRSDDAGQSWQRMPSLGVGIPALAIDPANSDHLYILAAWERVYESKDGGQSWLANWDGLGETLETASVAVDATVRGGSTVYVGAETGLYRSRSGEDWELVAPHLWGQSVLTLLVQPVSAAGGGGSVLYIGATRGIYRSLDGGQTVQFCDHNTLGWGCGLENISVTVLLADPANPRHLYAGTAYNGLYQSIDSGQTWQPIGPAELAEDVVEAMAWGPAGALFVAAESGVWRGVAE